MNYKDKLKFLFAHILFLSPQTNLDPEEKRRRIRERYIIVITAFLIIGLTFLESYISRTQGKLPISSNILVHFILNLNIILLVLLIFLVIRNIVKLFFERRRGILGTRLRTKLVVAFIALTIIPTLLLFWVSANLITSTIDNLFSFQVESSLEESLEIAKNYYQNLKDNSIFFARNLSKTIAKKNLLHPDNAQQLQKFIEHRVEEYNLGAIEILSPSSPEQKSLAIAFNPLLKEKVKNRINFKIPFELYKNKEEYVKIQSLQEGGELIRGVVPIFSTQEQIKGFVVVSYYLPKKLVRKMQGISNRFSDYQHLRLSQPPIKPTYILLLANITLLLFFAAIMFGFHLAKNLTGPIKELAEGTLKVAKGNLEVRIEISKADDEIGFLVDSFNQMIQDLKNGRAQLEQINKNLQDMNLELDKRRNYMEIVLKNVAAGVISIDPEGKITTINNSVGKILGLEKVDSFINKNYKEILPPKYLLQVEALLDEVDFSSNITFEKEIKLILPNKTLDLSTFITPLKDEKGDYLGLVIVVEDVTELQKGQRIAAWREVARRIAHEIKNPLTPIQLSAQRLRRRYKDKFLEDGEIFDECTNTIITQVELLKNMVNEFSHFARMPAAKPSPNYLPQIIQEVLPIFREAHKHITFNFDESESPPLMNFDPDQIKRALINIIENAVEAIEIQGEINIRTFYDRKAKVAGFEVADNGCGIPPEKRARLFEPYFSTKKSGTGLGLAIVESIISEHQGRIQVKDNYPKGTIFRIELPAKV